MLHNDIAAVHLGTAKLPCNVFGNTYRPGVKRDVEACVSSYDQCQKRKGPKQKHRVPMLIWPTSQPFYHIFCDILGILPISEKP